MTVNPFRGIVFHWLGGLAAGRFLCPVSGCQKWAWEVYWLVGGVFSWIIAPWAMAAFMTRDLGAVLRAAPAGAMAKAYFFGLWGTAD